MKAKLTKSPMERIAELETLLDVARNATKARALEVEGLRGKLEDAAVEVQKWRNTAEGMEPKWRKAYNDMVADKDAEIGRLKSELSLMVGERNKRLAEIAALQEKRRCANQREAYRSGLVAGLERAIALQNGGGR